jgi:hypothetical protein
VTTARRPLVQRLRPSRGRWQRLASSSHRASADVQGASTPYHYWTRKEGQKIHASNLTRLWASQSSALTPPCGPPGRSMIAGPEARDFYGIRYSARVASCLPAKPSFPCRNPPYSRETRSLGFIRLSWSVLPSPSAAFCTCWSLPSRPTREMSLVSFFYFRLL